MSEPKRTDTTGDHRRWACLPVNTDVTIGVLFLHRQEVGTIVRVFRKEQVIVSTSNTAETYNKDRSSTLTQSGRVKVQGQAKYNL